MTKTIEKISPIKKVKLRSEATVNFGSVILRATEYNLVKHAKTIVNNEAIDSHFSGELYFSEGPPTFIKEQLIMTHECIRLVLHDSRTYSVPDKTINTNSDLKFGITFSYATEVTDG